MNLLLHWYNKALSPGQLGWGSAFPTGPQELLLLRQISLKPKILLPGRSLILKIKMNQSIMGQSFIFRNKAEQSKNKQKTQEAKEPNI